MKEINIAFASDDNFARYCSVAITSLLKQTTNFINLYIIGNLNEHNRLGLIQTSKKYHNCNLKFINFDTKLLTEFKDIKINEHLTITTYCRLLSHILFPNLDKILYIDVDTLILDDVTDFYDTNIEDYLYVGVEDFASEYFKNRFNIDKKYPYINCGTLLINLKKLRSFDSFQKMKKFAKEKSNLIQTADQDIINGCFYDKIKLISYRYNFYHEHFSKTRAYFHPNNLQDYENSKNNPCIIHFVGKNKPWNTFIYEHKYTFTWWHYARMTPFYEEILFKNLNSQNRNANNAIDLTLVRETANYLKNKITYWRYRLLSKITFGKKRRKYKQKRKELKTRLKQVRAFLKGK